MTNDVRRDGPSGRDLPAESGEPTTDPSTPLDVLRLAPVPAPIPPGPDGQPWWQRLVRWAIVL